ncbi:MAG: hypothetical protein RM049_24285 [Nostoc sp. DedQUE04]|uniref:hypothetical protein n=1 Tax=Nostoc sp. DedQUE04 TaxID=3075390 RepID=UPI002AD2F113|nr:hypothetical protein [Nostoc sp. DedQUE04]MDZ8138387.1 hypothetical protein [Nostoc sp. DedQUE04]
MNNSTKKPLQFIPPKQTNPAVDELVALRQWMSEFRKDFTQFGKELSLKVAFGVIGSVILCYFVIGLLSLVFGLGR